MLKALYDYAIRENLTLPPGYVKKTIAAYIVLTPDGQFVDIQPGGELPVPAPDIGSLANGKDKSNVLLEKRSVVIPKEATAKSTFFLNALKDGGETEPLLQVCANALENEETAAEIRKRLDEKKIKDSERITFLVGNSSILESPHVKTWWKSFRLQFRSSDAKEALCLITGESCVPMATTTPISGLYSVGGHARGDALICFDKSAFCSYDLVKAYNAPVSEEAFSAVKAALDDLIAKAPPKLAGMKFVHWFDKALQPEDDPIFAEDLFGLELELPEEEDETAVSTVDAHAAEQNATRLVKSVRSGEEVLLSDDISYYILLLSGVGGRIMIRRYERGSYNELREKLALWHEDLTLTNSRSTAMLSPCKLSARLLRLLKYQKNDSKPFQRADKELTGITPAVLTSVISGTYLPDAVAARALAYIRSSMMSADDDTADALFWRDACVWQWLKVWLLRNKGKRGILMSEYNPDYPSNAYHCGAMVAVYETIQRLAMPDVNASVIQRYYASAIQSPALVFGTLSKMSVHHLEKLEKEEPKRAQSLRKDLDDVSISVNGAPPVTLNLAGQSEFALGYYQMCAKLRQKYPERNAAKKQKDNEKSEEE